MSLREHYDLLVILAGDKPSRHPTAIDLALRGKVRYIAVTGEQEVIDPLPELAQRILPTVPSSSTHEDALAIRALIEDHQFDSVLVTTSATQAERARLSLARELKGLSARVDLLTFANTSDKSDDSPTVQRILLAQTCELVKLCYYFLRRYV